MKLRHILSTGLILPTLMSASLQAAEEASGEQLFLQFCASCHLNEALEDVPTMQAIAELGANAVLASMNEGVMRIQAQPLSGQQRVSVAEYISGGTLASTSAQPVTGLCTGPLSMQVDNNQPRWIGWGGDERNQRFQAGETTITPETVGRLQLKWAYGLPNATQARSQPTIIDGVLYMASQTGRIQALDAKSGCTFWTFQAGAGVRTAISVADIDTDLGTRAAIFFTDATATAYAVDALNGQLIWTRRVDDHHAAAATGSPTYHDGVLYVPVSGVSEESSASNQDYECCTFRGSVSALNAHNGSVLWKAWMVDEPEPRGVNERGVQLWGPSGVAVWSAPTVDAERGLVYVATGNAYAEPDLGTSDAVVAMRIDTGEFAWVNQVERDVWIMGCDPNSPGGGPNAGDNPNCPDELGPDYDFSASPNLVTLQDGRDLLVVPQKSGLGFAFDPDNDGELVWRYRWGDGSPAGGVWGSAVDHEQAYFAVADMFSPEPGGMRAVTLATGEEVWSTPPQEPFCERGQGCNAAQSAALTTVPGLVISGANDGGVRIYSAENGEILWSYNTGVEFDTINGVEAKGGSIDGPGPIVVDGMLYVTSGNAGFFGTGGNVLLAFEIE